MDRTVLKARAKELRQKNWGVFLLSDILTSVVAALPLIGFVVSPAVSLGRFSNYVGADKGEEEIGWKKLYSKFNKQFESSFLFEILVMVALLVVIVAIFIVTVILSLITPILGIIFAIVAAFIVASVVIGVEYVGFYLLNEDPEMKGNVALKEAYALMKGHEWDFLLLGLSYIGKLLLILITFGIYGIWAIPEMNMANVLLAEYIANAKPEQASQEAVPTKACPQCGNQNEMDATFCVKCGSKL